MNIAFINPEYPSPTGRDHGGIATYIYNQANALAACGHTVHILAKNGVIPDPLGPNVVFHQFSHTSVSFHLSSIFPSLGNSVVWERGWSKSAKQLLLDIHNQTRLDIVEIPEYNGLAYELGPFLPFPFVIHFHTPTSLVDSLNMTRPAREKERWYRFEQKALRHATAFKCTSKSLVCLLDRHCKPPNDDVAVIYNLMPVSFLENIAQRTDSRDAKRIDILFSGRLERRKGAETVLHAINSILEIDDRINITFAGETELGDSQAYRQAIERACKKHFRKRIWFLGAVERMHLPALYRNSSIFLMPSLFDNAPNSLFEAMAARLPVVVSDVGGMNEIIRHGENGLLFPLEDHARLAECIRTLVADPGTAQRLAAQAYDDVVKLYNPERIAAQTLEFYKKAIAKAKIRTPSILSTGIRRLFHSLPIPLQLRIRRRISLLFHNAGWGDTLIVAAAAREIKKKYGAIAITVNGTKSELLRNNPHVDYSGNRYSGINMNYNHGTPHSSVGYTENLLEIMCARLGIRNPEHTVDIYLDENETAFARETVQSLQHPIITIHTMPGEYSAGRKRWPDENWDRLAHLLRSDGATIVHIGEASERPVADTVNRRGCQDMRRSIALVKEADLHIGVVSVFMHAAQAVATPAIILFGGFERYSAHSYSWIHPIKSDIECAPCALPDTVITPCPHETRCMKSITPEAVLSKAREIIGQKLKKAQSGLIEGGA